MKWILMLLLTFVFGCGAKNHLIKVERYDCNKEAWVSAGSAFAIREPAGVVTAAHLAHLNIRFCNEGSCVGAGRAHVGIGSSNDWAFFPDQVLPPKVTPFKYVGNPRPGLPVYAEGYPLNKRSISRGLINGWDVGGSFRHDAHSWPGSSGGPVYHGSTVYGVTFAIDSYMGLPVPSRVYAVPVRNVVEQVQDVSHPKMPRMNVFDLCYDDH